MRKNKILFFLMILFLFAVCTYAQEVRQVEKNAAQNIETIELKSKIFNNTRTLRILLPTDYKKNTKQRFPVFYFNDGYAVFHYWDVQQTVSSLIKEKKIAPIIIVGIDNAGEEKRIDEYLPYPDESEPSVPNPHGKVYPDFLTDEVMPLINKKYRTLTDVKNTGLGGASYGSYIALYTAIVKPNVFGRLLLESTPLFIQDFQILKDIQKAKQLPERISIGIGTKETPDEEINKMVGKNAERLADAMKTASPQTQIKIFLGENDEHNSKAWKRRLPDDLEFLLSGLQTKND